MYPEIDEELRKANLSVPRTPFLYHMLRLRLLIERKVDDKKLADEMLNEIYLSGEDLLRQIHEMRVLLERGS
jgi:DNA polymerase III delta prime subunit